MTTVVESIRTRAEAAIPDLIGRWDDTDHLWEVGTAPDGRRIAIIPLMYTAGLVIGHRHQVTAYDDRWCYTSITEALAAALAWDGTGEPDGWHRHPSTGRRRPDGDASREHINP